MTAGRDGRIVLTGPEANGRLLVVQLRRDGARDRSFSANGVAAVPLQGTAPEGGAGIGVFRDDRVFVAATLAPRLPGAPTRIVVARLLPDGSLDPGFGRGGKAVVGPPGARVDTMRLTYQGLLMIGGAVLARGRDAAASAAAARRHARSRLRQRGEVLLPGPGRVRDVSVAARPARGGGDRDRAAGRRPRQPARRAAHRRPARPTRRSRARAWSTCPAAARSGAASGRPVCSCTRTAA